ncbi:Os06g0304600, partial [Oryza sativa Japonica Group]
AGGSKWRCFFPFSLPALSSSPLQPLSETSPTFVPHRSVVSSPCSPAPLPSDLPFSAVVTHDDARIAHLASRLANNHPTSPSSSSLLHGHRKKKAGGVGGSQASSSSVPLTPGASVAVGNYVTRLGLGTPATSYVMVVDTGSSLTCFAAGGCS